MNRMTMLRMGRAAGLLVGVVALGSLATVVSAHGPDPRTGGALWNQDQAVPYVWRAGAVPPAAMQGAISRAAGDVNGSIGSRAATFVLGSSGNPIGYGPGATCGVNGLACFARTSGFTMWFREQGHVFDWGRMDWCQMDANPPNGCYDAETIALDEFGHVEGLDHHVNYADQHDYSDAVVQTYSRTKPTSGWNARSFGPCDVATLQVAYDVVSTTAKVSKCLVLPTTLTLFASAGQVTSGSPVTLTATLRASTDASFGQLRSNALGGRTVVLQRRDVGASTWTTFATMGGGSSGTYTTTAVPAAATQYRAVFATPTDEGVTGSTSGTVTVSVALCASCPKSVDTGGDR